MKTRQVMVKYGMKPECRYCGTVENLRIDHIHPRKLGGGDEQENLQVLCLTCNSLKHNMTEAELKEWLGKWIVKFEKRLKQAKIIITRI